VRAHEAFLAQGLKIQKTLRPKTPFGLSSPIHLFTYPAGAYSNTPLQFAVLSRHGEESYSIAAPWVNRRANIWALKSLGVERILSWSSPGSLNLKIPPGSIVSPHDLIDETQGRDYTFFPGKGLGFIRQNPLFCPHLREVFESVLPLYAKRYTLKAVYLCTQGPRLETPAEIKKYRSFGADLVGQTLAPEPFLAKELEMCYGALCAVVNYAEGIKFRPYKPAELFEGLLTAQEKPLVEKAEKLFAPVILKSLELLTAAPRKCQCGDAMLRYKRRGDIGEDWKNWGKG
jgi:5'-methylthioadenosine phosphorylase